MIFQGLLEELIERTGGGISLDLSVPLFSVSLKEPFAKLRQFFG